MKATPLLLALASCAALSLPLHAATTFSFTGDTWTNGASTQVGYLNGATSGSVTKDGITMTFQASVVGTAQAATRNLTLVTSNNPTGFNLATMEASNDLGGTLLNYQRWDFSFSQPVTLQSLGLDDVDSDQSNLGLGNGFRDAIAAEAFLTMLPGMTGSGIDAGFLFTAGTNLSAGMIATGNGQSIPYSISGPAGNPNNAPAYRTFLDFGSTPISSFSIYSFSDRDRSHRVSIFDNIIEINAAPPVPEPSVALLGFLALPLMARRRRE